MVLYPVRTSTSAIMPGITISGLPSASWERALGTQAHDMVGLPALRVLDGVGADVHEMGVQAAVAREVMGPSPLPDAPSPSGEGAAAE